MIQYYSTMQEIQDCKHRRFIHHVDLKSKDGSVDIRRMSDTFRINAVKSATPINAVYLRFSDRYYIRYPLSMLNSRDFEGEHLYDLDPVILPLVAIQYIPITMDLGCERVEEQEFTLYGTCTYLSNVKRMKMCKVASSAAIEQFQERGPIVVTPGITEIDIKYIHPFIKGVMFGSLDIDKINQISIGSDKEHIVLDRTKLKLHLESISPNTSYYSFINEPFGTKSGDDIFGTFLNFEDERLLLNIDATDTVTFKVCFVTHQTMEVMGGLTSIRWPQVEQLSPDFIVRTIDASLCELPPMSQVVP